MSSSITKPDGLLSLQQWIDTKLHHTQAENVPRTRVLWIRDTLHNMIVKALTPSGPQRAVSRGNIQSVDGTFTAGMLLPVCRFDYCGVTIKVRFNFVDWCVKVWGIDDLALPDFIEREFLSGDYEGMEDETDGEIAPPIRFCVGGAEKMYAILFWLLNTRRERPTAS